MSRKVSMELIAKKLGVSKNTVSLALRNVPGISQKTRKLILDTASDLGYQYKHNDKKDSKAKSLCVVMSKSSLVHVEFFGFIQLGIEDEAKRNDFNTILHYFDETEEDFEAPLCIKQGIVSGIVTVGRVSENIVKMIMQYGLPVVMVDHYIDNIETDCILTDNKCGGYVAAEYLIKFGHREIGFFGDIEASISFYDRYTGYLKALNDHDIPVDKLYSITGRIERLSQVEITEMLKELINSGKLPSAYVCCNDAQAILLMKIFKNIGISIPDEVSIIGFDNIELAKNVVPELTTMNVRRKLLGTIAVQRLSERIEEKQKTFYKLLLSPSLIERESVKIIKN